MAATASRTEMLHLRVTPGEAAAMRERASSLHRSLSDWARLILLASLDSSGEPERPPVAVPDHPDVRRAVELVLPEREHRPDPKPSRVPVRGTVSAGARRRVSVEEIVGGREACSAFAPRGTRCKSCGKVHP